MPTYKIEGMAELEAYMRDMGKIPQRCVTKAARKGANISLKAARTNAPIDTGELKKGIVLKGEKTRTKGKKVYQVVMDAAKNNIFVKLSKSGKRAYYPASQEYGFTMPNGKYTPGYKYMEKSIVNNSNKIEREIVDVVSKEVDKLK